MKYMYKITLLETKVNFFVSRTYDLSRNGTCFRAHRAHFRFWDVFLYRPNKSRDQYQNESCIDTLLLCCLKLEPFSPFSQNNSLAI